MKIGNKFEAVALINHLRDMRTIAQSADKIVADPNNRAHPFLNGLRAILANYRSALASLRACTNFTLACDIGTSQPQGLTVQAIMERMEGYKADFRIASVHGDNAAAQAAIAARVNKAATSKAKPALAMAKPRSRKPRSRKPQAATTAATTAATV